MFPETLLKQWCLNFNVHISHLRTMLKAESYSKVSDKISNDVDVIVFGLY